MVIQYPVRPGEADCRDYLRTGRCKYGEACKYNHPPEVESGGGIKPINPLEPLFPIRPNEPPCQYFLKHGTCKFAQSCKFNHPRVLSPGGVVGDDDGNNGNIPIGQLVYVTTTSSNATPAGAITNSGDSSSHLMTSSSSSVQVLPQRPTETNCIFFLRNGRCKYGATCKFHHPLDAINAHHHLHHNHNNNIMRSTTLNGRDRSLSTGSIIDGGRSQMYHQNQQHALYASAPSQRLKPITELVSSPHPQPTHILLPDGQIAIILDSQSLQNVSEMNPQDRPKYYYAQSDSSTSGGAHSSMFPSPMLTATTNSTSNNTFDSCIDLMGLNNGSYQVQVGHQQESTQELRQPQKSGSGGSLSAYGSVDSGSHAAVANGDCDIVSSRPPLQHMSPSRDRHWSATTTDGIGQLNHSRQQQGLSGSAASYWPSNGSLTSDPCLPTHVQAESSNYRSLPNFAPHRPQGRSQSFSTERNLPMTPSAAAAASSDQLISRHNHTQGSSGDDEGLSMMTSALLTMMDHHEHAPSSGVNNDSMSQQQQRYSVNSFSNGTLNINQDEDLYSMQKGTGVLNDGAPPLRAPPGMMRPPETSIFRQEVGGRPKSPLGGGFFIGGYDQPPPR